MTHDPDGTNPEDVPEGARKLDEDAAWRAIVENYGEEPDFPSGSVVELGPQPRPAEQSPPAEKPPPDETRFTVFEQRWEDPLNSEASYEDEGHFVPPEPPPLPKLEPRRKLAWTGLFGAPLLMLIAVVLNWTFPGWFSFLLTAGFLAGFGYLVATMPRSHGEDGSGDDGARL